MEVAVVIGNTQPASRTFEAGALVGSRLAGRPPAIIVDLAEFGSRLFRSDDPAVRAATELICGADVVVLASPARCIGLVGTFLRQIPAYGLQGTMGVCVMLGGWESDSSPPDIPLTDKLMQLGATCPAKALYLADYGFREGDALVEWLEIARLQIGTCTRNLTAA